MSSKKIIQFSPVKGRLRAPEWKPRFHDSVEQLMEEVQELMFRDGRTHKKLAKDIGVGASTIANIMSGKTRWPRHSTLFPLLQSLGYSIRIVEGNK